MLLWVLIQIVFRERFLALLQIILVVELLFLNIFQFLASEIRHNMV